MSEPRKELRERVEQQRKLLEEALRLSENDGTRIAALSAELQVVTDSLGGGWEQMSDSTAERLNSWLASSRSLLPGEKPGRWVSPPQSLDTLRAARHKLN